MSGCTAPRYGHRTASGAENCPACRYKRGSYGRSSGYGYGSSDYGISSYSSPSPSYSSGGGGRGSGGSARPRWARSGSSASYTPAQVAELTPVRETLEKTAAAQPDLRDVFLCHAWLDRRSKAKDLHDQLEAVGVKVWFSEKDLGLGVPMMRTIDRGLANSLIGLVLVTPAMLEALPREGVADKELSALLRGNRLVPIMDGVTFEELVKVSPLLASRSGLSSKENTWPEIIEQVADLVKVHSAAA
jgi:hypothetical protein